MRLLFEPLAANIALMISNVLMHVTLVLFELKFAREDARAYFTLKHGRRIGAFEEMSGERLLILKLTPALFA
jgi:hypothetical protein